MANNQTKLIPTDVLAELCGIIEKNNAEDSHSSESNSKKSYEKIVIRSMTNEQSSKFCSLVMYCLLWKGMTKPSYDPVVEIYWTIFEQYTMNMTGTNEAYDVMKSGKFRNELQTIVIANEALKEFEYPIIRHRIILELMVVAFVDNKYSSLYRTFLYKLAFIFGIPPKELFELELKTCSSVTQVYSTIMAERAKLEEKSKNVKVSNKWWKIGGAVAAGALLTLAAPVLLPAAAAGATFVGTFVGGLIGGAVGAGIISITAATATFLAATPLGVFLFTAGVGVAGASYGGIKMSRRLNTDCQMRLLEEWDVESSPESSCSSDVSSEASSSSQSDRTPVHSSRKSPQPSIHQANAPLVPTPFQVLSHDVVHIHGWIPRDTSLKTIWGLNTDDPWWKGIDGGSHSILLEWDRANAEKIGTIVSDTVADGAFSSAMLSATNTVVLDSTLCLSPPVYVLYPLSNLDSPWAVCVNRAKIAGGVLAELIAEQEIRKPITLIGYSVGSLVIVHCLLRLFELEMFGIVEHAVLMGSPYGDSKTEWESMRQVVCGKLVNVYCKSDNLLYYLHRIQTLSSNVAGLKEVEVDGITNLDVTSYVSGHLKYVEKMKPILADVYELLY